MRVVNLEFVPRKLVGLLLSLKQETKLAFASEKEKANSCGSFV
jgi:hypothetical protein